MKLSIISFLFMLMLVTWGNNSFAQRTVTVDPGFGTINNVIGGDTTAAGERVDSNTVYILQRGGTYILDGEFSPDYQCIIRSDEGTGTRPIIMLGVPSGGTTPEQTIRPRANFWISGCYITALDEFGGVGQRVFRFEENGIKIVIDDCHLDVAAQAAFRINTADNILYMTNSVISNMGTMASPENGRAFDDRGNDIDTLSIQNCTFYNLTFKVLRDGGGRINYVYFNHNTIVNTGMGGFDLGETLNAYVANNIFINPTFLGTPNNPMSVIITKPWTGEETQNIIVRNNNIVTDPALVAAYPDTIKAPVPYDSLTLAFITENGLEETNIEELVQFVSGPESPISPMTTYWQDPTAPQETLDTLEQFNFDFSYANTYQSYTAATEGQPVGDLQWFGLTPTSVNDYTNGTVPGSYELFNNYPNPFNPSTKIRYNIPANSKVSIKIYDVLGNEVATLINMEQQAGAYEVNFNAAGLSSGIYFYKLETPSYVQTNKMLLLK